jgi:hypothetical protein
MDGTCPTAGQLCCKPNADYAASKKFGTLTCQDEKIVDTDDPADICQKLNRWLDASHDYLFTYCTNGTSAADMAATPYKRVYFAYQCKASNAARGIVGGGATGQAADPLCFSQEECASAEYGGSADAFVSSPICPSGQGRCLAPEPQITLSSPVLGVSTVQGLKYYIVLMFRFLLSIVVITAAVMFVFGGFKYVLGATAGTIESAKETMVNATIGLVVTICATMLLNTVNPATTNLNRLDIYLMKKQLFTSGNQWCRDMKPQGDKASIMFASAGVPSGSISFADAKFTVTADKTKCAQQYYPESYAGAMCDGQVCPEGGVCLQCSGLGSTLSAADAPDCSANPKGTSCVKVTMGGDITWTDNRYPTKILLLPICNSIQPGSGATYTMDTINTNIYGSTLGIGGSLIKAQINLTPGAQGTGNYFINITDTQMKSIEDKCCGALDSAGKCTAPGQGTRGFLLAVQYKDPFSLTGQAAKAALSDRRKKIIESRGLKGVAAGAVSGALFGPPGGALAGAVVGAAAAIGYSPDDMAIVAPYNCGADGQTLFPGYADGTNASTDFTDAESAIYCGWSLRPGDAYSIVKAYGMEGAQTFNWWGDQRNAYFGYTAINDAVRHGKSVACNLNFSNIDAPSDPSSEYLGCCESGSKYSDLSSDDGGTRLWCKY